MSMLLLDLNEVTVSVPETKVFAVRTKISHLYSGEDTICGIKMAWEIADDVESLKRIKESQEMVDIENELWDAPDLWTKEVFPEGTA